MLKILKIILFNILGLTMRLGPSAKNESAKQKHQNLIPYIH